MGQHIAGIFRLPHAREGLGQHVQVRACLGQFRNPLRNRGKGLLGVQTPAQFTPRALRLEGGCCGTKDLAVLIGKLGIGRQTLAVCSQGSIRDPVAFTRFPSPGKLRFGQHVRGPVLIES